MTAPSVLTYGPDACQNWLTDALYYGTTYADQRWPLCKGGIRVMTASQPVAPAPSAAGPTGASSPTSPTVSPGTRCSGCRTPAATVQPIAPGVPIEQPAPPAAPPAAIQLKGLPWWVWVLALVAGSQLFNDRAAA